MLQKQSYYSAEFVKFELTLLFVRMDHPNEGPSLFLGGRGDPVQHTALQLSPSGPRIFPLGGRDQREE
jgi:hypothetical protein